MPKIQGMAEPILNAAKKMRQGSRNVAMGVQLQGGAEHLKRLYEEFANVHGAGVYYFEVFDNGGNDKDHWTIQLGSEPETPMDVSGPGQSPAPAPLNAPFSGGPPGAGGSLGMPMNLGNGFYLTLRADDPTKGFLTTPQRQVLPWSEGQDLPPGASLGGRSATAPTTANQASGTPMPSGGGGWGSYPAIGGIPAADDRVKMLEDQLRAERERAREEDHRREIQSLESKFEKMIEAQNRRHEELLKSLQEKKSDPEADAIREQNRQLQQQLEVEKREREAQRREDQIRQEIHDTNARFEKMVAEMSQQNKSDPMVTMLTTLMQSQQHSSQQMMQAMETAAKSQSESNREHSRMLAERFSDSMVKPSQIYEFIRMAKDRGPENELHKQMSEAMQTVFGMMQNVVQMQSDLNPGEPAWMSALRQGMDQVGQMGAAYFQQKATTEEKKERQEAHIRARNAALAQRRALAARQAAAEESEDAQSSRPSRARRQPSRPMTPDEMRAAAAAEAESYERGPDVEEDVELPTEGESEAAPMPEADEQPDILTPGVGPETELPPGTTQEEAAAHWRAQPAERIRELVSGYDDVALFGPILSKIEELRAGVTQDQLSEDQVVEVILEAAAALKSFNQLQNVPAMDLLTGGHISVLMERLLPDAPEMFVAHCVGILQDKLDQSIAAA